jgi:imidazolonepropionase-like amidohydrolase
MYTVIKVGQLIDGTSNTPTADAIVAINGDGRIDYAGPANGFEAPPGATIYEDQEWTVLPGLIDAHVHITQNGHLLQKFDRGKIPPSFAESALTGLINAQRTLEAGFTTVRDLNAPGYVDIAVRDKIEQHRFNAARLFTCGQGLCISGGHMDRILVPDHMTISGRVGVCDTPQDFRAAVRQHVKRGVNFIKVNANGRKYVDGEIVFREEMTFEELEAACGEAHKFERHVAAHTAGGPPTDQAILAGVDTVEHGRWLTDRSIELLCERGGFWVPTFLTSARNTEEGAEAVGASPDDFKHLQLAHEATFESFGRARKAGVKIAAGTDCGFVCDHGDNARELMLMVDAGFTPMEAIQSATKTNAELLGLQDDIGTLEPGKLADVLVVRGNPLEQISHLHDQDRIQLVFKEGRLGYHAA